MSVNLQVLNNQSGRQVFFFLVGEGKDTDCRGLQPIPRKGMSESE